MTKPFMLAVLCASWCSSCERFRPEYFGPALEATAHHRLWIDIEDDADALPDDLEIASLPMLVVAASPSQVAFFGAVRPDVQVVQQLARLQGADRSADELLARIVSLRL